MSIYFIIIAGLLLSVMAYKRHFPVRGIPCVETVQDKTSTVILDIRDYNAGVNHNQSDMHLPYAYMKRYSKEIPNQKLHVIASEQLDLHLGLRYLKRKGHQVASYQLSNCPCENKE